MIILASASPRRQELLRQVGIEFRVVASGADEALENFSPDKLALENARRKAAAVAGSEGINCPVLGADTVVSLDGKIFGKPKDEADARMMLQTLSGRVHCVYTGVSVICNGKIFSGCDATKVTFDKLSDDVINSYIKTGEPMGKAGAYAVQGRAAMFIPKIDGSFSNVVGLPIHMTVKLMKNAGIIF